MLPGACDHLRDLPIRSATGAPAVWTRAEGPGRCPGTATRPLPADAPHLSLAPSPLPFSKSLSEKLTRGADILISGAQLNGC